jgi:hypothetical protein
MNRLMVKRMDGEDKGLLIPSRGYNKFIKKPINIKLTRDSPTVSRNI